MTVALSPQIRNTVPRLFREFWRYGLASAVALGLDFALLWFLTEPVGLHYLVSAAISYSSGAVLHYFLSIAFVFRERRLSSQRVEFVTFFAVGLVGLAANQLVLWIAVDGFGINYLLGKAIAAGLSFVLNFATRRLLLFTRWQPAQ